MMTRKARFLTAVRGNQPDRLPMFDFLFQQPLYDDPALLPQILRLSNEYNKEAARSCVAAGCHAMWVSDDLGDSSRGFLKLVHFRELYLPYLVELAEYVDG